MSDCRFENCKDITEYTSKIKDLPRQVNTSGGAGGELGEWAAVGFLLKNLTDTYSQRAAVIYSGLRTKATPPTLEDLVRELCRRRAPNSNLICYYP
jgi:hypothetical protein